MNDTDVTLHLREAAYFTCGEWSVHVRAQDDVIEVHWKGVPYAMQEREMSVREAQELAAALHGAVQWQASRDS